MTLEELEIKIAELNSFKLNDSEYYEFKELFVKAIGRHQPRWSYTTMAHHARAAVTHGGKTPEEVWAKAVLIFR